MSTTTETAWGPLSVRERRILGVLIEKQKTTPEYYPMTVAAIVAGCNQKSNRDPVTNYDADDVEETLQGLRRRGATVMVEGVGRTVKWKHALYDWLDLKGRPAELAILAELMLRGAQTEGELRTRASRMDEIADLTALQGHLEFLAGRKLVVYLTPPGQRRGVTVTHGLYSADELERLRQTASAAATTDEPTRASSAPPGVLAELERLRTEMEGLRDQVQGLADELHALKSSLGS